MGICRRDGYRRMSAADAHFDDPEAAQRWSDSLASIPMRVVQPWTAEHDRLLVDLYVSGSDAAAIAEALGRTTSAVQARVQRLRIRDRGRSPLARDTTVVAIRLPNTTLAAVNRAAEQRELNERQVVCQLVMAIARDDLFSAVLDG